MKKFNRTKVYVKLPLSNDNDYCWLNVFMKILRIFILIPELKRIELNPVNGPGKRFYP
jgi:hypothetical protein